MKELISITTTKVRFSEVDSMQIVWHGNYVKFLEDGREAFGKQYGLGYYDVYDQGFMIPIVKVDVDYKNQVKYGDELEIKTIFKSVEAAKIYFNYEIRRLSDKKVVAKATTIQVFLDTNGELQLTNPEFYSQWKTKHGL
ncbi:acyl-CoA thioesterase [Carboxylicivirga sp. RSCT41]|uniref:acyl-CoA thioesterase n=1 Tax=Carboxylicivirga agarovorans TaxID=3417570 RepID=UPI003D34E2EC